MTVALTNKDIKTHIDVARRLPVVDDLGVIDTGAKNYWHQMTCRFWDTFCDDTEREKEWLNNANNPY